MRTLFFYIVFLISMVCAQAQTYITIYTKFGTPIEGIVRTDITQAEKSDAATWVNTYYPNATILSEATTLYNCHSYAWNMQDGGATCWINAINSNGGNNISKYWGSREYYGLTTESNATKIHYYNGDHSAIPSPTVSGKYISKWGAYPLMLHSPDYCPYPAGRNFYCKKNYTSNILECSVWNRGVYVGETANYYITDNILTPYGNTLDYRWSITDNKEYEDVIGSIATISINGNNANISFNKSGLYIITCDVYTSAGEFVSSYTIEGVVEY